MHRLNEIAHATTSPRFLDGAHPYVERVLFPFSRGGTAYLDSVRTAF